MALNRCSWHQSGHLIAAGDDNGRIHMCDVGEVSWCFVFKISSPLFRITTECSAVSNSQKI